MTRYTRRVRTVSSLSFGQGSTANVLAALASFLFPGLGQLLQGRLLAAFIHFVASALLWIILLGWLVHIFSAISAARFTPRYVYDVYDIDR
ncbi:MAG: hypothetical protein AAF515_19010 [Pseudomonadota bacterium]